MPTSFSPISLYLVLYYITLHIYIYATLSVSIAVYLCLCHSPYINVYGAFLISISMSIFICLSPCQYMSMDCIIIHTGHDECNNFKLISDNLPITTVKMNRVINMTAYVDTITQALVGATILWPKNLPTLKPQIKKTIDLTVYYIKPSVFVYLYLRWTNNHLVVINSFHPEATLSQQLSSAHSGC